MKKIALCSLMMCLGVIGNVFAASFIGSCELTTSKTGRGGDHDFIYFSNGLNGLACNKLGNKQCNPSQYAMVNGSHYVGSDAKSGFHFYKCVDGTGVLDPWKEADLSLIPMCSDTQVREYAEIAKPDDYTYMAKRNAQNNEKNHVKFAAGNIETMCKTLGSVNNDAQDCPKGQRKAAKDIKVTDFCDGNSTCTPVRKGQCYDEAYLDCIEAAAAGEFAIWNPAQKKCNCTDNKGEWDPVAKKCGKKITPTPTPVKSCKDKRITAEGKACCDLPSTVAEWKNNKCICKEPNPVFAIVNGKGTCSPAGGCDSLKNNPEAYACCMANYTWNNGKCECPDGQDWKYDEKTKTGKCEESGDASVDTNCYYTISIDIKCANRNTYKKTETIQISEKEARKMSCAAWKQKVKQIESGTLLEDTGTEIDELDALIKKVCKSDYVAPSPSDNSAEVAAAKKTLSAFFETTKQNRNVWRDKDGNFNTARLASDLTAGVVLGTVGGVVSGVVIKKKQVEKGFDALHCTVGGQTVADWGDTFTVGLR